MNLETQINPQLWQAVKDSYQTEDYSRAVTDAMSFVTDVLRDRSGLDGDGPNLVRAALTSSHGNPPRIRINKFQTETERDEQRGLHEVLAGMYTLVRNPRTHERRHDSQQTADTLILFIDYLLTLVGKSQQSFTTQDFVESVADPHFVPYPAYIDALVEGIPFRKTEDALIALWRDKNWTNRENFGRVIAAIVTKVSETTINDFLAAASDELLKADNAGEIALAISVLPAGLWPQLAKTARLRAEHMLVKELADARYHPDNDRTNSPRSTWISHISKGIQWKDELQGTVLVNLLKRDFGYHNFVARYLFGCLPDIFGTETLRRGCINAIAHSIREGNEYVKNRVANSLSTFPSEWITDFLEELKDLTDPNSPELYLPDGRPFLGRFEARSNPAEEDEIPF